MRPQQKRSLRNLLLIAALPFPTLLAYLFLPSAVSRLTSPNPSHPIVISAFTKTEDEDLYALFNESGAKVEMWDSIKVSETRPVRVRVQVHGNKPMEVELTGPVFDFSMSKIDATTWEWLVHPKQAGSQLLRLNVFARDNSPNTRKMLEQLERRKLLEHHESVQTPSRLSSDLLPITFDIPEQFRKNVRVDPHSLLISVNVLTDLGFTPTEEAWAKLCCGFAGLLGTVFGYPFIKKRLEREDPKKTDERKAAEKVDEDRKTYAAMAGRTSDQSKSRTEGDEAQKS